MITHWEFPSGTESMAAWTDLKSPSPLISTLMVRLVPIFSVNKGELMTVWASKAWTRAGKVIEMTEMMIAKAMEEDMMAELRDTKIWLRPMGGP
jgi:hypothetical protein